MKVWEVSELGVSSDTQLENMQVAPLGKCYLLPHAQIVNIPRGYRTASVISRGNLGRAPSSNADIGSDSPKLKILTQARRYCFPCAKTHNGEEKVDGYVFQGTCPDEKSPNRAMNIG